jgi:hypothetical protein
MAHVQDPPELLHWARDTLNGITVLRGQAAGREIDLSDVAIRTSLAPPDSATRRPTEGD